MVEEVQKRPLVLVLSSQVGYGRVGGSMSQSVLSMLGYEVVFVPTVWMAYHPGFKAVEPVFLENDAFSRSLDALYPFLEGRQVSAVLSGYFADLQTLIRCHHFIETILIKHPECLYLCDPIMGDKKGLYLSQDIVEALKDKLLPLAHYITPNLYELAFLDGQPLEEMSVNHLVARVRTLFDGKAIVTSMPAMMKDHIGVLYTDGHKSALCEHRAEKGHYSGTGDLFAALFVGALLRGVSDINAVHYGCACVGDMIKRSSQMGCDYLYINGAFDALYKPQTKVRVSHLMA